MSRTRRLERPKSPICFCERWTIYRWMPRAILDKRSRLSRSREFERKMSCRTENTTTNLNSFWANVEEICEQNCSSWGLHRNFLIFVEIPCVVLELPKIATLRDEKLLSFSTLMVPKNFVTNDQCPVLALSPRSGRPNYLDRNFHRLSASQYKLPRGDSAQCAQAH